MFNIPNIDTLRNNFGNFAARGAAPSIQYSQRYGGGYQGAAAFTQAFNGEPDEFYRRGAAARSKSFNDAITSAFEERIQEVAPPPAAPSYAKIQEQIDQFMPSFSTIPQDFLANLTASQSYAQKTDADAGLMNVAATLKTAEDATAGAIQLPEGFIDASSFTSGIAESQNLEPNIDEPIEYAQPERVDEEPIEYAQPERIDEEPVKIYSPPPPYIPPPAPPYQPEPTYSRADGEEDDEEIESIDVVGRRRDDMDDDEIESIDVVGRRSGREELESIDVEGRGRDYLREARDAEEKQASYGSRYQGDNPWERFKQMYVDLYTGGEGGSILEDFNRREDQGEFDPTYKEGFDKFMQDLNSPLSSDTNEILRARTEREQLMDTGYSAAEGGAGATIINNNQTIATAKSMDSSKTGRVFSDDSTFNRAAASDAQHPRYG